MRKNGLALAAAALALAALSCSNSVDLLGELTDSVMEANDRFLAISSTVPLADAVGADPNGSIVIRFDRAVDEDSVDASSITVVDSAGDALELSFPASFEDGGKTVRVWPATYFENATPYTVSIADLSAADGSMMMEPRSWRFTTGTAPAGSVVITSNNADALAGYTDSSTNTITLNANDITKMYTISNAPIDDLSALSEPAWTSINGTATLNTYDIGAGSDGEYTVYVGFRYTDLTDGLPRYSSIKSASVVYDSVLPVVNAGSDVAYPGAAQTLAGTASDANPLRYQWSASGMSFGAPTALSTSASGTIDGARTVYLYVTDAAGHTVSDTLTFYYDATPTYAPVFSNSVNYTLTASPTLLWEWSVGDNASGYFKYKLEESGTLSGEVTSKSYSLVGASDGVHTLYVQQRDGNHGYYSDFRAYAIHVTAVYPYDGMTRVSKTPRLQWRSVALATYVFQVYNAKLRTWTVPNIGTMSGTTYTVTTELSPYTDYTWRVVASVGKAATYLPSLSGATFTTGK